MVTSTRESFTEMFDNDDTLEYEPAATVAIMLTGQDEEAEEAALEVSTPRQLLHMPGRCWLQGRCCLRSVQPLFAACCLLRSGECGYSRPWQASGLDRTCSSLQS